MKSIPNKKRTFLRLGATGVARFILLHMETSFSQLSLPGSEAEKSSCQGDPWRSTFAFFKFRSQWVPCLMGKTVVNILRTFQFLEVWSHLCLLKISLYIGLLSVRSSWLQFWAQVWHECCRMQFVTSRKSNWHVLPNGRIPRGHHNTLKSFWITTSSQRRSLKLKGGFWACKTPFRWTIWVETRVPFRPLAASQPKVIELTCTYWMQKKCFQMALVDFSMESKETKTYRENAKHAASALQRCPGSWCFMVPNQRPGPGFGDGGLAGWP